MTAERGQRLSAALRAQAAGLASPTPVAPEQTPQAGHAAQSRPRLPAWAVLLLAALLGGVAGGLAGAISAW